MKFTDRIGKEYILMDGGMGTLLQARGLAGGVLPESWNFIRQEDILAVHRSYLEAGSDVISTNTFGCNRYKLQGSGLDVSETAKAAVGLVKKAIADFEAADRLAKKGADDFEAADGLAKKGADDFEAADSCCHYVALDVGPLGKLMKPIGNLCFDEAVDAYRELISAGVSAGADLILCETFTDNYDVKAAVIAAKECCDLPIIVSVAPDKSGKLLTGGDLESLIAMLEGLGVTALGMNCGFGPDHFAKLLPTFEKYSSLPLIVQPNAGLPQVVDGKTVFMVGPDEFGKDMAELAKTAGIAIVGGCCGTTPDHIKAVKENIAGLTPIAPLQKNFTVISSYSHAVYFGERPLLIGERINPTGKKLLKQALRDNNISYICDEAIAQEEAGADILDVNCGLPEINECEMMERCLEAITGISDLPLQIDTADISTLERGLRIYNGKPLLNSVNGKVENMKAVFPLAKKYGAAVVCLLLDEEGIPETVEKRLSIADKIIASAAAYGIDKKDLIFDALTMTVSTGELNGRTTLETVRRLHSEYHVNTVLGVSNISFGLPIRSQLTTAFFTMCLSNGLSSGIINPLDERLMSAYDSYITVAGYDSQCMKYLEKYADKKDIYVHVKELQEAVKNGSSVSDVSAPAESGSFSQNASNGQHSDLQNVSKSQRSDLQNACIRGLSEKAALLTDEMLKTVEPLTIIDSELIPALDYVGQQFEAKKMFLPQLLTSAEAAKAAFARIKEHFNSSGVKREPKGKIILATVKGDVHDIGKNIVKVLLENYDYEVMDLGKDVSPETVLDSVLENNVKLVGLSALMTTTVVSMEDTIKLLHEKAPFCKIVVGGAVLTEDYAKQIAADRYAADAMATVRYAEEVFVG